MISSHSSVLIVTGLLISILAAEPATAGGWMSPLTLGEGLLSVSTPLRAAPQCADGIIYDDGTVEDGLSFTGATVTDAVMRFDTGQANTRMDQVCVCWTRLANGASDLFFDLVFYADDGIGGEPGSFIDGVAVAAGSIPVFPGAAFYDFSIADLDIRSPTENVFAGVSWFPSSSPGVFLCTDDNGGGTQPMFASGDLGATWQNLRTDPATSGIDALVVRVTPISPLIFADGFESGDTSAWSEVAGL